MINKSLSMVFIGLLLFSTCTQSNSAQTTGGDNAGNIAKIKANVLKRGADDNSKVNVKLINGTKIKGFISQVGEDSFTLTDSKTKQTTTLAYSDIAQIKGTGLSIGSKIAIGVGVFAAVMVIVLVVSTDGNLGGLVQ